MMTISSSQRFDLKRFSPHASLSIFFRTINQELLKEEDGFLGDRGLVSSYQGEAADRLNQSQVFTVYITDDIRRVYESKMQRLAAEVSGQAISGRTSNSWFSSHTPFDINH